RAMTVLLTFISPTLASAALYFCTAPATAELNTLSLHDALPIWPRNSATLFVTGRPSNESWFVCSTVKRSSMFLTRGDEPTLVGRDRKSTRLNSSHVASSYAVFCLKKKKPQRRPAGPDESVGVQT